MFVKLNAQKVIAFKQSWPCHGLDAVRTIAFDFEDNGDLVDIVARGWNGRLLDSSTFDGPALLALANEAQEAVRK